MKLYFLQASVFSGVERPAMDISPLDKTFGTIRRAKPFNNLEIEFDKRKIPKRMQIENACKSFRV